MVNTAYCILMLIAKVIQCIVFGPLRVSEKQVGIIHLHIYCVRKYTHSQLLPRHLYKEDLHNKHPRHLLEFFCQFHIHNIE